MMRIITGSARGIRLATPEGDNTRPTSERAKEAVFSMLQPIIGQSEVLDLFAGSGQMALEAVSRGASRALLCDLSREAVAVIRKNIEKTKLIAGCEVVCADYLTALRQHCKGRKFDVVFLDPPYAKGLLPDALRELHRLKLLRPDARIVCESAAWEDVFGDSAALPQVYEVLRQAHYGIACVTILTPKEVSAS